MAAAPILPHVPADPLPIISRPLSTSSATSPLVSSSIGDVSPFESKAWQAAVPEFRSNSKHDIERLERFLRQYMSPQEVEKACREKQRDFGSEYGSSLSKILSKIEIFVNAGNLAVKAAPETIGLAWTGISLTLNALQDDFQTFQGFITACADIISILLTCRLFTGMSAESQGPHRFLEIQKKVIDEVSAVYGQILEFSYQMFKTTEESKYDVARITKSLLRKNKVKFDGSIQGLSDGERTLSEYATKATQALSLHYLERSDGAQTRILEDLKKIEGCLNSSIAGSRELQDLVKGLEVLKARTSVDVAKDTYEKQVKQLNLTVDLESARAQRIGKRDEGTCQWMYDVTAFKEWRNSPNSSLLWVFGRGNSGKSTLVYSVIGSLEADAKEDKSILVHYFFCRNGDDDAQLTDRILGQVLCTLYRNVPTELDGLNKCNELIKSYLPNARIGASSERQKSGSRAPFEKIYADVAQILGKKSIIIVIDALDECIDREQADFIGRMKMLVSYNGVAIKVFISSRPETDINKGFSDVAHINIEKHNDGDIKQVVKKKLDEIPGLSPPEVMEAYKAITKRADSFFGYIGPALETLRKPWKRPLSGHLDMLPKDILNMNAQIFHRIDPAYVGFLKTCLTWTILANGNQKVLVDELIDIFSGVFLDDESDWTGKELIPRQMQFYKEQITLYGSAFMEVDIDSREISLIKPAIVKDSFLVDKSDEPQRPSQPSLCSECAAKQIHSAGFSLNERDGQLEIALTIFRHLNSPIFCQRFLSELDQRGDLYTGDARPFENTGIGDSNTKSLPVAEDPTSAIESLNLEDAHGPAEEAIDKLTETDNELAIGFKDGTAAQNQSASSELNVTLSADTGGRNVVEGQVDAEEPRFDTFPPQTSDESVSDADSDYQDDDPIEAADFDRLNETKTRYELKQYIYHLQQVEKLWRDIENKPAEWNELWDGVEKFFTPDSRYFKSWAKKYCFNFKDISAFPGWKVPILTPLYIMANAGLIEGTRRLLGRGDQVDAPTSQGLTPLHGAAELSDKQKQIEPMAPRRTQEAVTQWSMLQNFAARGTDPEIVKILIDAGAEINAIDENGETALHTLVARQDVSKEMVKAFLAAGADVKAEDKQSQQPMYECAKEGTLETIEVLLDHSAEVDDLDEQGWTALSRATFYGRADIARVLVESGADPGRSDVLGRTIFYLACQSANMGTVRYFDKLFKEKGKTEVFDQPAANGKTPLRKACASASVELPRFLLEELGVPVEVDARDNSFGRTALHVAAHRGFEDVVDLLIHHGASTKLLDNQEKTALKLSYENWPLAQASDNKTDQYEKTICRLIDLDRRAAVDDLELLNVAAARGSIKVLQKLIHGQPSADLTRRDEHGWNAVDHARQWRTKDAEDFLIEKGTVGKYPSAWMSTNPRRIIVSEDGLSIWQAADVMKMGFGLDARHTVFSDHPIPSRTDKYYFEITISDQAAKSEKLDHAREIAFGVSQRTQNEKRRKKWLPGLPSGRESKFNSWGWHGDDGGCCKTLGSNRITMIEQYGPGDTVGCAVDYANGIIFFIKNGKRLMEKAWSDVGGRLYCCVGISDPIKATANFRGPFVWEQGNTLDFEYHQAEATVGSPK